MKYDIYFHNDFDGRASAAVLLSFLQGRGDDIEHYVPLDFDILPQWVGGEFFKKHTLFRGTHNPAIVVDFPYHPGAAIWFDHHPTTFKKRTWQKKFRADTFHRLEPRYPSCCHLVFASLKKDFKWKPPRTTADLVKWLDIIDGAQYRSPKQTIELKEPALQVDAFIEGTYHDLPATIRTVRELSTRSLSEIARLPEVKKVVRARHREIKKDLVYYRKHLQIFKKVTVIDLTSGKARTLRYAPYYLFPKIPYAIRLTKKGKWYHASVTHNAWRASEKYLHLGEIAKRYGGGGHKGAAGIEFKTLGTARRTVKEIAELLNTKG